MRYLWKKRDYRLRQLSLKPLTYVQKCPVCGREKIINASTYERLIRELLLVNTGNHEHYDRKRNIIILYYPCREHRKEYFEKLRKEKKD